MEQDPYLSSPLSTGHVPEKKKSVFVKTLIIICSVFGVLLLLIIALVIWIGVKTNAVYQEFDGRAEPFAENFLRMQDPWSFKQAKPQLSRLWLESVDEGESAQLFEYFNNLGSLSSIGDLTWEGCSTFTQTGEVSVDRCDYLILAQYQYGDAEVRVGLVLEEDDPKIIQLRINSNAFLK